MDGRLSPELRAAAVAEMTSVPLDVLVVGGGVVGAGVALDAVTRGLSVGLVEMRDWGSGSSSRSSMIVNGGLRYLDALDLPRMRSGLAERGLLFDRIAPHLLRRVPFLFPLRSSGWERLYLEAGLTLDDALGWSLATTRGLSSHRHLSRRAVRRIAPGLRPEMVGAMQYYGAQVDDARYVITLVRTAAAYGAQVASRIRADGLIRDAGRVSGVEATDGDTGRRIEIRAKVVVGAAGAWSDDLVRMAAGDDGVAGGPVQSDVGVHLIIPRDRIRSSTGLIARTGSSVLLIIPWGRHWIIGTTRTPGEHDLARPTVSSADIDQLLGRANAVLASPLTRDDIQGCYAGLWTQPLPGQDRDARRTADHQITSPAPGLVLVTGGTFSSYRRMAAEVMDEATRVLGGLIADSITDRVPLLGADGYQARWNQRHLLARRAGLHVARVEHLLNRYGSMADQLLDLVADDPELRRPVPGAEDYLAVEIVYAVSYEGATHLTDLMSRRTRIAIETWDRGVAAAPHVAQLAAQLLDWDDAETQRQITTYLNRVEAERASEAAPRPPTPEPARNDETTLPQQ